MKKVCFIINPIAGGGRKNIQSIIEQNLNGLDGNFFITKYAGHAKEFVLEHTDKYNIIVAVGGDGTVNEIATALSSTDVKMGIIPTGSGNGLARALGIPTSIKEAIKLLHSGITKTIDCIKINNYSAFNIAGTGFDAVVAQKFSISKKRGFFSYLKIILREYFSNHVYKIKYEIEGNTFEDEVFLFCIANSSQFGNNAHIAPKAKPDDGIINLILIKPFPIWAIPFLIIRLFSKRIYKSAFYSEKEITKMEIFNPGKMFFHYDGEPVTFTENVNIELFEKTLKIITP